MDELPADDELSADICRTRALIATDKCGHQKASVIPSPTLDKLEKNIQECTSKLEHQMNVHFKAEQVKFGSSELQVNQHKLCLQDTKLNHPLKADKKDSSVFTFEDVKAYLETEVGLHRALLFDKNEQLIALRNSIKKLEGQVQEEGTLNHSAGREALTMLMDDLSGIASQRTDYLAKIINKYFPKKRQHKINRNLKSMRKILKILLDAVVQSRTDPAQRWVKLDDTFWPPFVRDLVKSGVAENKPCNSKYIGMINFG